MLTEDDFRQKLREEFMKNKHVTDIRVIDKLVIKVCIINIYRNKKRAWMCLGYYICIKNSIYISYKFVILILKVFFIKVICPYYILDFFSLCIYVHESHDRYVFVKISTHEYKCKVSSIRFDRKWIVVFINRVH